MVEASVAIVGGGIGGLTAALSMQRAGVRVSVYERTSELGEVGAGLIVSESALRGLDFLGICDAVRALAGKYPERGYHTLKHFATGEVIQPALDNGEGRFLSIALHRADLQSVLVGAVRANDPGCLHLGHEFASVENGPGPIRVSFTNGTTCSADAVIGADGGTSAVRSFVFGDEPVDFTGKVSYRGLIPEALLTPELDAMSGSYYLGPERMFLTYYVRGTEFLNVVAHSRQLGWAEEGWSIPRDERGTPGALLRVLRRGPQRYRDGPAREPLQVGAARPVAEPAVGERPCRAARRRRAPDAAVPGPGWEPGDGRRDRARTLLRGR